MFFVAFRRIFVVCENDFKTTQQKQTTWRATKHTLAVVFRDDYNSLYKKQTTNPCVLKT